MPSIAEIIDQRPQITRAATIMPAIMVRIGGPCFSETDFFTSEGFCSPSATISFLSTDPAWQAILLLCGDCLEATVTGKATQKFLIILTRSVDKHERVDKPGQ